MSGVIAAILAYATGGIGGKVALWLAGKFGGKILDRVAETIKSRRAEPVKTRGAK